MKNKLTFLIALAILAVLLSFMFFFQVRYDEVAVLTTFEKADKETSIKTDPGLYFRWPWPVQRVGWQESGSKRGSASRCRCLRR